MKYGFNSFMNVQQMSGEFKPRYIQLVFLFGTKKHMCMDIEGMGIVYNLLKIRNKFLTQKLSLVKYVSKPYVYFYLYVHFMKFSY